MRPSLATRLRGARRTCAVAIVSGAIGIGIGVGVSGLSDKNVTGSPPAGPTQATAARSTTTAVTTTGTARTTTSAGSTNDTTAQTPSPQNAVTPSVMVLSAVLYPSATPAGRQRRRARVSVSVRVTNRDTKTLTPPNPLLLTGRERIGSDARAARFADALIRPLGPSKSATGELRFEISGAATDRLHANPHARLGIVNRIVVLRITISPTPAPPD